MKKTICILFLLPLLTLAQDRQQIDSLNTLIESAKLDENWKFLINIHFKKGKLYYVEKEYSQALLEYLIVDSISTKNNYVSETTITATIHRAKASRNTFTYDGTENANTLLLEALKAAEIINNEECIYMAYKELAYTKGLKGEYAEAKRFTNLAFPYYLKKEDYANISWLYSNYANYYYAVDSLDKAREKLIDQLNFFRNKTDSLQLADALYDMARYHGKKTKNYQQSLPYLQEGKIIYEAIGKTKIRGYLYLIEDLALCNAELNNYQTAYNFYKQAYSLRKAIVRESNNNLTRKLEAKYQAKQKKQEITLLQSQKQLTEQQKVNQRNLLLGGLGITTLAGLFFFFQYRNRQKTNKKLRELDAVKSNFFVNISHEFRTPLTLIQSPIEDELNKTNLPEAQRKKFKLIKRNSNRLLTLVDQLLMLSKAEGKVLKLQVQEVNIRIVISAISSAFEYSFDKKGVDFKTTIQADESGYIDVDFIKKILTNLLSNALKYTSENEAVSLNSAIKNSTLQVEVSNSGNHLTQKQIQNIFNKFYQLNTDHDGFGLGLSLVKELVDIHKGTISVSSNHDTITFKVNIPISKKTYNSREISIKDFHSENYNTTTRNPIEETTGDIELISSEKPLILIVEDYDDMRNFTKSLFINDYNILEAKNGKTGIEKALEHIPDIILSDVMMPKVNGIELVETLKNDEKTSHIPIVLLTAKTEEEDQVQGILTGADDYITKPFNPKLLRVKIETLHKNLEKLRAHYSHEVLLKPALFSVNSTEKTFFNKLQTIIDEELQNPDFNVDAFSHNIGMSRMQLHRKLKATLGISASEFLRTERLKTARHLLQTSDLSISEVAYSTGFNDANYFSKSFKKLFQITPMNFKERLNK